MGFDQYHEPASDLSQETRTFARMIASLQEECEAIGWYQQRISVEQDAEAKSIMEDAQKEEYVTDHYRRQLFVGISTVITIQGNKIAPGLGDKYLGKTGFKS